MTKKILLCPPTFYDIEYEINPWMNISNKVNRKQAFEEYNLLKQCYQKIGVNFYELTPTQGLPDQVYTTDTGHPEGNIFIKSNYRYPQRRKEADIAAEFFKSKGYEIKTIPDNIFLEGQGDFLKVNGTYFFGWGKRSSFEAKEYLEKIVQKEIIDIELKDPYFYHLDTCLGPLSADTAIICESAFTPENLEKIKKQFKTLIPTSKEDNDVLACNLIVVDKNVIVNGISQSLKSKIESLGYTVHTVPMKEYLKGGGSIKCVSLQIFP